MVGRRTEIIGPCGSSSGGGATNNCCGTIYQAGSVALNGLEWATDYTITMAAPIGTVTVTDQGSVTWTSDVVQVSCTVDGVTVTDEYTVTMTATGNAPGEVIVTVALTSGGGYGGASGCCETTEGGFAWKYVNCCIVDPLAGWSMTRDPSGFSGKECEIGGCEICVTPQLNTVSVNCMGNLHEDQSTSVILTTEPTEGDRLVYTTQEAPSQLILKGLTFATPDVSNFIEQCQPDRLAMFNEMNNTATSEIVMDYVSGEWIHTYFLDWTSPNVIDPFCVATLTLRTTFAPCGRTADNLKAGLLYVELFIGDTAQGSIDKWTYYLHEYGSSKKNLNVTNQVTIESAFDGGDYYWPVHLEAVPSTLSIGPVA